MSQDPYVERSIEMIKKSCWISLTVGAAAFVFVLLNGAETVSINDKSADIREIQAMTNVNELQIRAIRHISLGASASGMSIFIAYISLGALLVTIVCASITLLQLRQMRKTLNATKSLT
jgi:hypothetical protein